MGRKEGGEANEDESKQQCCAAVHPKEKKK
jgi:hypothetical protein